MSTIEIAQLFHGRTDDRHDWQVHVSEVSLWRLALSRMLDTTLHAVGICCGRWGWWRIPHADVVGFRLLNSFNGIDNSHLHRRYTFKVADDWVKEHAADFWAEMHEIWADDDAANSAAPSTEVLCFPSADGVTHVDVTGKQAR